MSFLAKAWHALAIQAESLRELADSFLGVSHRPVTKSPSPFQAPQLSLTSASDVHARLRERGLDTEAEYMFLVEDSISQLRLAFENGYTRRLDELRREDQVEGLLSRSEHAASVASRFRLQFSDAIENIADVVLDRVESAKQYQVRGPTKARFAGQSPENGFVGPIRLKSGFTNAQNEVLLRLWQETDQLEKREVAVISRRTGLSKDQIRKWFSNRRSRYPKSTAELRLAPSARRRKERSEAEEQESRVAMMEPFDRYISLHRDARRRGTGAGLARMPLEFWIEAGLPEPHSGIQIDNDFYKWSDYYFEPVSKTVPAKKVTFATTLPRWEPFFFGGEYQGRRVRWTQESHEFSRPTEAEALLKKPKKRGVDEMEDWESEEVELPECDFGVTYFDSDEVDVLSVLSERFIENLSAYERRPVQPRSDDLVYPEPDAETTVPDFFAGKLSISTLPTTPASSLPTKEQLSPEVSAALAEFDIFCETMFIAPAQTPEFDEQMCDVPSASCDELETSEVSPAPTLVMSEPDEISASQVAHKFLHPTKDPRFQQWRASRPPIHIRLAHGDYSGSPLSKELIVDEDSESDSGETKIDFSMGTVEAVKLSGVENEAMQFFKDPVKLASAAKGLKSSARLNKFGRKVKATNSESNCDADNESSAAESQVSSLPVGRFASQETLVESFTAVPAKAATHSVASSEDQFWSATPAPQSTTKNAMVERWIASDLTPHEVLQKEEEERTWKMEQRFRLEEQKVEEVHRWQNEQPLRKEVRMLALIDQYYERMAKKALVKAGGLKSILKKSLASRQPAKMEFNTDSQYPALFNESGEFQPEAFDLIPVVVKSEFPEDEVPLSNMDIDEIFQSTAAPEASLEHYPVVKSDQWWISKGANAEMKSTDELLNEALSTLGSY